MLLLLILSLPQPGHAAQASADDASKVDGVSNRNPGSELWRNVRQREFAVQGFSQIKNVDSNILIHTQADAWARFRVNTIISLGMYVLGALLLSIVLFYLIRGRVEIEGGLSGRMVHRFNQYERVIHWVLALVFLFLTATGLILMFGRTLLIPVLGHEIFSIVASFSKQSHNLVGPVFLLSLILMLLQFVKRNIYAKGDLSWLLKGGGMIGKSHVTGGFFNMGEKSWYWIVILVGLLISATGLILVLPNLGLGRSIMELSHIVHSLGAIFLIAVSIGHMYLGSVGTAGTRESMKSGYVDIKWAEAHHERWAKQCHEEKLILSEEQFARVRNKQETNLSNEASLELEKNK